MPLLRTLAGHPGWPMLQTWRSQRSLTGLRGRRWRSREVSPGAPVAARSGVSGPSSVQGGSKSAVPEDGHTPAAPAWMHPQTH